MPPAEVLYAENLALKSEREALQGVIPDLQRQLEWMRRQVFGAGKSEKLDRLQLLLKLQGVEAELAARAAAPKQEVSCERRVPRPEKRAAPAGLHAKLPITETVVIEPGEVKAEPEAFEKIGEERTFDEARQRVDGLAAGAAPVARRRVRRAGARAAGGETNKLR